MDNELIREIKRSYIILALAIFIAETLIVVPIILTSGIPTAEWWFIMAGTSGILFGIHFFYIFTKSLSVRIKDPFLKWAIITNPGLTSIFAGISSVFSAFPGYKIIATLSGFFMLLVFMVSVGFLGASRLRKKYEMG